MPKQLPLYFFYKLPFFISTNLRGNNIAGFETSSGCASAPITATHVCIQAELWRAREGGRRTKKYRRPPGRVYLDLSGSIRWKARKLDPLCGRAK